MNLVENTGRRFQEVATVSMEAFYNSKIYKSGITPELEMGSLGFDMVERPIFFGRMRKWSLVQQIIFPKPIDELPYEEAKAICKRIVFLPTLNPTNLKGMNACCLERFKTFGYFNKPWQNLGIKQLPSEMDKEKGFLALLPSNWTIEPCKDTLMTLSMSRLFDGSGIPRVLIMKTYRDKETESDVRFDEEVPGIRPEICHGCKPSEIYAQYKKITEPLLKCFRSIYCDRGKSYDREQFSLLMKETKGNTFDELLYMEDSKGTCTLEILHLRSMLDDFIKWKDTSRPSRPPFDYLRLEETNPDAYRCFSILCRIWEGFYETAEEIKDAVIAASDSFETGEDYATPYAVH